MTEYFVTWEIELTAASPQEAARQALEIQRDPKSWANSFDVRETTDGGCGHVYHIDLQENIEEE